MNKPTLQLQVCSKSCQNGRRLHPYLFVRKQKWWSFIFISYQNIDIPSFDLQSSFQSIFPGDNPPAPSPASDGVQLQPSALLFTLYLCRVAQFIFLRSFHSTSNRTKGQNKMKSDAAHADGAKQINTPGHITSPEVQKSCFSGLHTRLEHYSVALCSSEPRKMVGPRCWSLKSLQETEVGMTPTTKPRTSKKDWEKRGEIYTQEKSSTNHPQGHFCRASSAG